MATSPNSTEESSNTWTCSPEDSPARISHKPGSGQVSRDLAAAFGLSSPVLLGNLDPDSFLLRMSQGSLFQEQCPEWSENWPDSGMWDAGAVYELQSSALPTLESGSSSWPTASASVANDGEGLESWEARKVKNQAKGINGNGMGTPLTIAAQQWPTPNAHNATGARGAGFELTDGHYRPHDLVKATDVWRTPDSPASGGPRNRQDSIGNGHQVTIAEQAEHWNTPHGMSNRDFRGKIGGCGGGEFAKQANQWQTPATDSFRSSGGDRKDEMGLDQQARSHQVQAIPDGPISSESGHGLPRRFPTPSASMATMQDMEQAQYAGSDPNRPKYSSLEKRRLNPRFVSWLMGFPVDWTEI